MTQEYSIGRQSFECSCLMITFDGSHTVTNEAVHHLILLPAICFVTTPLICICSHMMLQTDFLCGCRGPSAAGDRSLFPPPQHAWSFCALPRSLSSFALRCASYSWKVAMHHGFTFVLIVSAASCAVENDRDWAAN